MSAVRFKAHTGGAVATGTSAKTILQILAASNHAVWVNEIHISFQGTSNTASPILVEVLRQTTAGTMSSGSIFKDPDDSAETLQTSCTKNASAEPTASDILYQWYVHPQTGFSWQAAFGQSIKVGGGDRLGVRVTAAADVNSVVALLGEE
jgi:hypothetical protein